MALSLTDDDFKTVESGKIWNPETNRWEFTESATAVLARAFGIQDAIIRVDSLQQPKRKRTKVTNELKIRIAECIKQHPEWSDFDVATEVGLDRKTIRQNKILKLWAERCRHTCYGDPKFDNDPYINTADSR